MKRLMAVVFSGLLVLGACSDDDTVKETTTTEADAKDSDDDTTDTTSGDTTVFDTGDSLVDSFAQAHYDELLVQGFNDEEANCIVAGVLDSFTAEELIAAIQSGDSSQIESVTTDVTPDCVSVERLGEIGGR
jgi:hypothetical protein